MAYEDDPLVVAVNRFADLMNRRWVTLRNLAVAVTIALIAIAIALWLLWGVSQNTNRTATQIDCAFKIARTHPTLSQTDPQENLRLIDQCVRENL